MIYIFCALYCEAAPLISALGLKQRDCGIPFDCFADEKDRYLLTLTGVGQIKAAAAAAAVCTHFGAGGRDFFVNIGTCAGLKQGEVYICNKITAKASERTYYPDMIVSAGLEECEALSVSRPCCDSTMLEASDSHTIVAEMEAEGFFTGVGYFAGPDRIALIKAVSDTGTEVNADTLKNVMEKAVGRITAFLEKAEQYCENTALSDICDDKTDSRIGDLCEALHCSVTMAGEVRQLFRYLRLEGCNTEELIEELYRLGDLPCKDRREGKKVIERLKERVL